VASPERSGDIPEHWPSRAFPRPYAPARVDETRPLEDDERALLLWFAEQWSELSAVVSAISAEDAAAVFQHPDGYRTIEVTWTHAPSELPADTPFPGEASAEIDGYTFTCLLFASTQGAMLEMWWSPDWRPSLPPPETLRPVWHSRS
jgi:hypothetical protein